MSTASDKLEIWIHVASSHNVLTPPRLLVILQCISQMLQMEEAHSYFAVVLFGSRPLTPPPHALG
jgi:hypothetical protein